MYCRRQVRRREFVSAFSAPGIILRVVHFICVVAVAVAVCSADLSVLLALFALFNVFLPYI